MNFVREADCECFVCAVRESFCIPDGLFFYAEIAGYCAHEDIVQPVDTGLHPVSCFCGERLVGVALDLVLSRSEEHTSELQSRGHLVCRLLLEKRKQNPKQCNDGEYRFPY